MRILVHICCGPCGITVLQRLRAQGHELTGLFFNPNIQPLAEYMRRREGAALVAARLDIPLILADSLPEAEQYWRDPWLPESGERERPDAPPPAVQAAGEPSIAEIPPNARVKGGSGTQALCAAPLRGVGSGTQALCRAPLRLCWLRPQCLYINVIHNPPRRPTFAFYAKLFLTAGRIWHTPNNSRVAPAVGALLSFGESPP